MTAFDVCQSVYDESRQFYIGVRKELGHCANGISILYGPASANVPILFLGEQPGGTGEHDPGNIPNECIFATAPWPLARRVREVWGLTAARDSTALNMNFFHAASAAEWNTVPPNLKTRIEEFCRIRALRMISAIKPQRMVVIGSHVFDRLGVQQARTVLVSPTRGLVLVREGRFAGVPLHGVIHLTGYPLRREERTAIREYFQPLQ